MMLFLRIQCASFTIKRNNDSGVDL